MNEEANVDIEAIMQEIRAQILAKQAQLSPLGQSLVHVNGRRFPPEFYEHLYRAALAHKVGVQLHVTPVNIPLIGPIVAWVRGKIHALVVFYVNRLAEQQQEMNRHLLQAVDTLAQAFEETE